MAVAALRSSWIRSATAAEWTRKASAQRTTGRWNGSSKRASLSWGPASGSTGAASRSSGTPSTVAARTKAPSSRGSPGTGRAPRTTSPTEAPPDGRSADSTPSKGPSCRTIVVPALSSASRWPAGRWTASSRRCAPSENESPARGAHQRPSASGSCQPWSRGPPAARASGGTPARRARRASTQRWRCSSPPQRHAATWPLQPPRSSSGWAATARSKSTQSCRVTVPPTRRRGSSMKA